MQIIILLMEMTNNDSMIIIILDRNGGNDHNNMTLKVDDHNTNITRPSSDLVYITVLFLSLSFISFVEHSLNIFDITNEKLYRRSNRKMT